MVRDNPVRKVRETYRLKVTNRYGHSTVRLNGDEGTWSGLQNLSLTQGAVIHVSWQNKGAPPNWSNHAPHSVAPSRPI